MFESLLLCISMVPFQFHLLSYSLLEYAFKLYKLLVTGLSMRGYLSFHQEITWQLLCFSASVKYRRPFFVKFSSLRNNLCSLQLLCSSAAAKSFAALSVKLLFLRSNVFSLQLLCSSAAAKSFAALSVKLLLLSHNVSSLQLLCLSAAAKSFAALSVKLSLLSSNVSSLQLRISFSSWTTQYEYKKPSTNHHSSTKTTLPRLP